MKKSELRQIIREEIQGVLNERESIFNIGDQFRDEEGDIFTITKIYSPEWTTNIESITLKDEDGIPTTFPDDFDSTNDIYDHDEFFKWFEKI